MSVRVALATADSVELDIGGGREGGRDTMPANEGSPASLLGAGRRRPHGLLSAVHYRGQDRVVGADARALDNITLRKKGPGSIGREWEEGAGAPLLGT